HRARPRGRRPPGGGGRRANARRRVGAFRRRRHRDRLDRRSARGGDVGADRAGRRPPRRAAAVHPRPRRAPGRGAGRGPARERLPLRPRRSPGGGGAGVYRAPVGDSPGRADRRGGGRGGGRLPAGRGAAQALPFGARGVTRRILVTGGAGYIGSVVVEQLVAAGAEVVVLDDLSRGHRVTIPAGVGFVAGGVGDAGAL